MAIYRHGDVLLKKIDTLPNNTIKQNTKTIALGEVTGHSHRFDGGQVCVFENKQKQKFVEVTEDTVLIHEEHKSINVIQGVYEVIIEREYDIFSEAERQVLD